jgi:hypothetical protein
MKILTEPMDKDDIQNFLDASDWGDVQVEYAQQYSSGDMLIMEDHEEYPVAKRITHAKKFGGKVYKRYVLVIWDWEKVND